MPQVNRTEHHVIILKIFDNARQEERRLEVLRGHAQQLTGTIVLLRHTAHRIRPSTHRPHLRHTFTLPLFYMQSRQYINNTMGTFPCKLSQMVQGGPAAKCFSCISTIISSSIVRFFNAKL